MTGFDYLVVSDVSSKYEVLDICCFVFWGAGVYIRCEICKSFSFLQNFFKEFAQNLSIWPPSAMSKWNICSCYRMPGTCNYICFVFQLCLLKTTTKTNIRYSTSVMNNVLSISSSDLIMCIQGLKFEYYVRFVLILFVISFKCSKLRNFQHIIAY